MTLEQELLQTPPPRRLQWRLVQDSPTGASLRAMVGLQLACLALCLLPFVLPHSTWLSLCDFVPMLETPLVWSGLWLLGVVGLLGLSRSRRARFRLAERGKALRGRLVRIEVKSVKRLAYFTVVPLNQWLFTVRLPDGQERVFNSGDQPLAGVQCLVTPGAELTVLGWGKRWDLLGLMELDPACQLLQVRGLNFQRVRPHRGWLLPVLSLALFLAIFYVVQYCAPLDDLPAPIGWLALGLAGVGAFASLRAWPVSPRWMVAMVGFFVLPAAVLGLGWVFNCGFDFRPVTWQVAQVTHSSTRMMSPQMPLPVGELTLEIPGVRGRLRCQCRASRLATFGTRVWVRVNRGALGFRWLGEVRPLGDPPTPVPPASSRPPCVALPEG